MNLLLVDDKDNTYLDKFGEIDMNGFGIHEIFTALDTQKAWEILAQWPVQIVYIAMTADMEKRFAFLHCGRHRYEDMAWGLISPRADFDLAQRAVRYGADDLLVSSLDDGQLHRSLYSLGRKVLFQTQGNKVITFNNACNGVFGFHQQQGAVAEVQKYIRKNIEECIHINELADLVHMHPKYLMRLFKKECGLSIMEYANGMKLEVAKQLLRYTNLPVEEVSQQVGYNASYFFRFFKNQVGKTPAQYRSEATMLQRITG